MNVQGIETQLQQPYKSEMISGAVLGEAVRRRETVSREKRQILVARRQQLGTRAMFVARKLMAMGISNSNRCNGNSNDKKSSNPTKQFQQAFSYTCATPYCEKEDKDTNFGAVKNAMTKCCVRFTFASFVGSHTLPPRTKSEVTFHTLIITPFILRCHEQDSETSIHMRLSKSGVSQRTSHTKTDKRSTGPWKK